MRHTQSPQVIKVGTCNLVPVSPGISGLPDARKKPAGPGCIPALSGDNVHKIIRGENGKCIVPGIQPKAFELFFQIQGGLVTAVGVGISGEK